MRRITTAACSLLIAVYVLFGCGKKADLVVATIGEKKITVEDLYRAARKVSPKGKSGIKGPEEWRKCLDLLINKELLVLEAKNRGLDRGKKVTEALKEAKRRLLLRRLYDVEVVDKTKVTDEQAREYFEKNRLDEKVRISRVLVKTESEAKQILKELGQGKSFAEIARQKSTDKRSAAKGGDAGWFIRGQLSPKFEKIVFSMEVGQISQPVKVRSGYCILKVTDKKKMEFEEVKDEIKKKLFPQATIQRRKEHSNSLRVENHLQYEAQGLKVFLRAQRKSQRQFPELSPEEGRTVLYRFDGGKMTLIDFAEGLKRMCPSCKYPAIGDSAAWKRVADQVVLEHVLLPRAARQLGLDKDKKVLAQLEQRKEEFMAERLREIEVLDKVNVTEAKIREYFNAHRDEYVAPARAEVVDILLKGKEQAERILQWIEQGADMERLAEKYSTLKRPGKFRWKFPVVNDRRSEGIFGKRFVQAVFEAKVGETVGPIQVRGGYAVFKVLKREAPRRRSLQEVRGAVTTILKQEEEERLFNELIESLREKYRRQIAIYEEVFQKAITGETDAFPQS
ncbi:MAG: peptidyl-prolyl cis-trans isomerase [Candidatus Latescibacteria bacterium]|nr:peptidyl-prolyl cis-trans isomerase [Candidatus Latescibacterota bacterium]